jgi:hypothetical protein
MSGGNKQRVFWGIIGVFVMSTPFFSDGQIVTFVSPTNNSTFIAPANFTLLVNVQGFAGAVTNVELHSASTNSIAEMANTAPYPNFYLVLTNQNTNDYIFSAQVSDDSGLNSTSSPVIIHVIGAPPFKAGSLTFGADGYFHQSCIVSNPTYSAFSAVRIYISGITNPAYVANATGTNNGLPYIQPTNSIAPYTQRTNVVLYYNPSPTVLHPVLSTELISGSGNTAPLGGTFQSIDRGFVQAGQFTVEFPTISNRVFCLQYSSDLSQWFFTSSAIGNGLSMSWNDADLAPEARFYRLILLP